MVALTNYMAQILVELIKLANTVFTVNKALASARRISDVLDAPISMSAPETGETPTEDGDEVLSFRNVSMRYTGSGEPSLSGIAFSARRGETVGIIGSTGSGKSTLANLIPRFYDPAEGEVYVLGQDVRAYSLSDLRDRIAIVPQKATLFSGTVRSNLLWGNPDATDGELWEALERAQAKSFVEEKEGGLDAPVSQNGKNLSGGQRQRLTIARALVRRAPILILDDSSSALDYATDAALRHALRTLPDSPTVLLISQRTSSILHADKILVLEDGECVGQGTHDELLATCEVYREIHESQYRREVEKA